MAGDCPVCIIMCRPYMHAGAARAFIPQANHAYCRFPLFPQNLEIPPISANFPYFPLIYVFWLYLRFLLPLFWP